MIIGDSCATGSFHELLPGMCPCQKKDGVRVKTGLGPRGGGAPPIAVSHKKKNKDNTEIGRFSIQCSLCGDGLRNCRHAMYPCQSEIKDESHQ